VSTADEPVSAAEAKTLFDPLARASALILAVSGGPDSTALLLLAARWRRARRRGPKLVAVTVDHGLRRESAREARAAARLARRLGVPHRTIRWEDTKPATGLQEAAREARYRLLAAAAARARARYILTGHTLDDQAETVLIRLTRGSGLGGLGAMRRIAPLPGGEVGTMIARPLLELPKARLLATLARAGIDFASDPSNRDPRFTRARLRDLMPALAREGLDARRFALLARRMQRAECAIETAVGAAAALSSAPWSGCGPIRFNAEQFARLPAEVALRLLGRAITHVGDEGPVELGKLETLFEAIGGAFERRRSQARPLRRTLAGALVTLTPAAELVIERAPARAGRRPKKGLNHSGIRRRQRGQTAID
jgi:tRNA(Ile)-lysidine synthase